MFGRRPDARSRGRTSVLAGSGTPAGNTTNVIGVGAVTTDVVAVGVTVLDVIAVGA